MMDNDEHKAGRDDIFSIRARASHISEFKAMARELGLSQAALMEEALEASFEKYGRSFRRRELRSTQINFRCTERFKDLAHALADHLDCSIADVMEDALVLLAKERGYGK